MFMTLWFLLKKTRNYIVQYCKMYLVSISYAIMSKSVFVKTDEDAQKIKLLFVLVQKLLDVWFIVIIVCFKSR